METEHNTVIEESTDEEEEIKEPSMYKVFIVNDDYTPMEFVVQVLTYIFNKNEAESFKIMREAHEKGQALIGIYTLEVAETKTNMTSTAARESGYPLQLVMEKE